MNWIKLNTHLNNSLHRGALIKFPTSENTTDFAIYMVCESPMPPIRLGLIRIDGYDAGINCHLVFPDAYHIQEGFFGLECKKIYDNWRHWVSQKGNPDDVLILPEGLSADDLR
jgi:hypothetical protein